MLAAARCSLIVRARRFVTFARRVLSAAISFSAGTADRHSLRRVDAGGDAVQQPVQKRRLGRDLGPPFWTNLLQVVRPTDLSDAPDHTVVPTPVVLDARCVR